MTKSEFDEAMSCCKFKMKPEHLSLLFGLVEKYEVRSFAKAILKINELEKFPNRNELFKLIELQKETKAENHYENQWYIVKRGKTVRDTSFSIKKSFWAKHGSKNESN